MRQFVKDIIADIDAHPARWRFAYCTWERDDGVEVWRANLPILDIGLLRPQVIRFTFREKVAVWLAFRRWSKRIELACITGEPT